MNCPHLKGKKIQTCRGNDNVYVPSIFELEEYCRTAKAVKCPLLYTKMYTKINDDQNPAQGGRNIWLMSG
jgi:hypothetical protein